MPRSIDMDERWRQILTEGGPWILRAGRRLHSWLPSPPRCKLCFSPFGQPGAALVALSGRRRWKLNPQLCTVCVRKLGKQVGGAEIGISLLFADVRGSTTLAEQMPAPHYAQLLNRFYGMVARVVDGNGGVVDKLIGDGVLALFIPGFSDSHHARHAVEAGRELLERIWDRAAADLWIPVGIGVHTGSAYVGVVGSGEVLDFTAVGDATNVVARLGSAAGPGELLVSHSASQAGDLTPQDLERRHLELKGRVEPLEVVVLQGQEARRS